MTIYIFVPRGLFDKSVASMRDFAENVHFNLRYWINLCINHGARIVFDHIKNDRAL